MADGSSVTPFTIYFLFKLISCTSPEPSFFGTNTRKLTSWPRTSFDSTLKSFRAPLVRRTLFASLTSSPSLKRVPSETFEPAYRKYGGLAPKRVMLPVSPLNVTKAATVARSEEHTSELQSQSNLV